MSCEPSHPKARKGCAQASCLPPASCKANSIACEQDEGTRSGPCMRFFEGPLNEKVDDIRPLVLLPTANIISALKTFTAQQFVGLRFGAISVCRYNQTSSCPLVDTHKIASHISTVRCTHTHKRACKLLFVLKCQQINQ